MAMSRLVDDWVQVMLDAVLLESGQPLPWPSAAIDAFTDHTRYQVTVSAFAQGRRRLERSVDRLAVSDLIDRVGTTDVTRIKISVTRPWSDRDEFSALLGYVEVDQERQASDEAHYAEACLSVGPAWDRYGAWQSRVVEAFTEAARMVPGDSGLLTVDALPVAHEYALAIPPAVGRKAVVSRLRGYAWGNLLSSHHIATLGGPDRVVNEAPVAKVIDLSDMSGTRLFLQLTPSIDEFSDESLQLLKCYLLPVLDTTPRQTWVEGPPLRLA